MPLPPSSFLFPSLSQLPLSLPSFLPSFHTFPYILLFLSHYSFSYIFTPLLRPSLSLFTLCSSPLFPSPSPFSIAYPPTFPLFPFSLSHQSSLPSLLPHPHNTLLHPFFPTLIPILLLPFNSSYHLSLLSPILPLFLSPSPFPLHPYTPSPSLPLLLHPLLPSPLPFSPSPLPISSPLTFPLLPFSLLLSCPLLPHHTH